MLHPNTPKTQSSGCWGVSTRGTSIRYTSYDSYIRGSTRTSTSASGVPPPGQSRVKRLDDVIVTTSEPSLGLALRLLDRVQSAGADGQVSQVIVTSSPCRTRLAEASISKVVHAAGHTPPTKPALPMQEAVGLALTSLTSKSLSQIRLLPCMRVTVRLVPVGLVLKSVP